MSEYTDPPCLITNFIHGVHLTSSELNCLGPEAQKLFAKDIATFVHKLHQSMSVEEVRGFREQFEIGNLDDSWSAYFEKHLSNVSLPNIKQSELVAHYYGVWQRYKNHSNIVVVHDDLKTDNLLFDNEVLVGVLDFGDTNIGTPEQELRQLYRINEMILRTAVETYSKISGIDLSIEAVKAWAVVQEMSSYVDRLSAGSINHPSFIRASKNLNNWLPEGNWGK